MESIADNDVKQFTEPVLYSLQLWRTSAGYGESHWIRRAIAVAADVSKKPKAACRQFWFWDHETWYLGIR